MLWDTFQRLGNSYYNIWINPDDLFNTGDDKQKCQRFIEKHFEAGEKIAAFNTPFRNQYYRNGKHIHTVFLYLMGLSARQLFEESIKNSLSLYIDDLNDWYSDRAFMYSWFLTCLFHDAASCIEDLEKTDEVVSVLEICKSFPTLKKEDNYPFYSKKTVFNYFEYKKIVFKEQDHGIIGGCYFYQNLKMNYDRIAKKHITTVSPYYEYPPGIIWRHSHIIHFAYVANAIICHNLWTADSNDSDKVALYHKFGLDELIINNRHGKDNRISRQKNPLSFLLCLLDTIEPTKRFTLSPKTIAENIEISVEKNDNIKLQWTETIKTQPEFWKWANSIIGLSEWMQVEVSSCSCTDGSGLCSLNIHFL